MSYFEQTKHCVTCQDTFTATSPAHVYCSEACNDVMKARRWALSLLGASRGRQTAFQAPKAMREYVAGLRHPCAYCHKPMAGIALHCSSTCRTLYHRGLAIWDDVFAQAVSYHGALPGTVPAPRFESRKSFELADTVKYHPGTMYRLTGASMGGQPILHLMPAYQKPSLLLPMFRDGLAFMCERAVQAKAGLSPEQMAVKARNLLAVHGLQDNGVVPFLREQWLDEAFAELMKRRESYFLKQKTKPRKLRGELASLARIALDPDTVQHARAVPPVLSETPETARREAIHRMMAHPDKTVPEELEVLEAASAGDADSVRSPEGRQWTEEEETYTCPGGRTFNPWKTDPRNPGKAALAALYIGDEPGLGVVQAHLAKARAFTIRGGWDRDTDEPGPIEEISPGCFIADKEYLYS
jgi:predicted nucleic acid-binding Zn ribbon protein